DTSSDLHTKLIAGLECDALITSGGVSVGDRDLVLETLKQIGAEVRFWKVNIKPGMPFAFCLHLSGAKRPVPIFALPGNPVSTMVTFLQLVRPALGAMRGLTEPQLPVHVQARLEEDYAKSDGKRHFARGVVRNKNNELLVRKSGSQSSGVLTSMSVANCLIVIPEHETMLRAGSMVTIQLLGDSIGG
ncbi:MAG TPA: molybdopterin-binding protein, partial [Bacteroidota bacterium]|nr:molybdopterin-binding protein [Bacteroidota bacterium]